MFANLKNKLIEEVRASPSKFQQLAAQAQAAVSSSSTTPNSSSEATATNENFFSITEEDTPQNTPLHLPLPTSRPLQVSNNGSMRTRRLSNSSVASDVSFRLPSYDAPATYHLQSDLESEFGSEFGDESTSPNKLDVITKEKLFEAYKKTLERYNKKKSRYNDLVKQYKELERDSTKARAVLMETQEKALRRINELREQCSLEQGAKAHLEQALRIEMDDMKCKLHAYETKLQLLGKEYPESIKILSSENLNEPLIDLQNDTQLSTALVNGSASNNNNNNNNDELINLDEIENSDLKLKIHKLENELANCNDKLKELNEKYENCIAENAELKKQEEENALLLAQTKQAIHTELEGKESEVKKLQEELKQTQSELEMGKKLESQMNAQSNEIKEVHEKLKRNAIAKQEVEAKLIAIEHMYNTLKGQNAINNDKKQQDIDEKFKDNEHKLQDLRQQNAQLNEMLQRYQQNEISLAEIDNELNRTKNENDNLRETILDYERKLETTTIEFKEFKESNEKKLKEIEENFNIAKQRIVELEEQNEKIQTLQIELENRSVEEEKRIATLKVAHQNELQALRDQLNSRDKELKTSGNKVAKHKKHQETQQHKIKEQTDELEKLRDELNKHAEHLQSLHLAARDREEQTEVEKAQLKSQMTNIVQEISLMEEQMRIVQQSHAELEIEKRQLELHIENMQRMNMATSESAGGRLFEVEKKLQNIESENTQLGERNCLLEENINRLEKLLAEKERKQNDEIELLSNRLETKENNIQKLNEKLTEVLDENTHMHNAQELMDHDYRSLQNKYDALEKEKLMAEDSRNLLEIEIAGLKTERNLIEEKLQLQQKSCLETAANEELENLRRQNDELSIKCENEILKLKEKLQQEESIKTKLLQTIENLTKENTIKSESVNEMNKKKSEDNKRLEENMNVLIEEKANLLQELQITNEKLQEQAKQIAEITNKEEDTKNEHEKKLHASEKEIEEKTNEIEKLQDQMSKNAKERFEEHESLKKELSELIEMEHRAVEQLEEQKEIQIHKTKELEEKLQTANGDIERLHENNFAYQLEIEKINSKNDMQVEELTITLRHLQDEHSKLQEKIKSTNEKAQQLNDYEQLKIENEYLKKHIQHCEERMALHDKDILSKTQEIEDLKEKFKSFQCEFYVLKENELEHQAEMKSKEIQLKNTQSDIKTLREHFETQSLELTRQSEHSKYITQQNDDIQKELLHTQHLLTEAEQKLQAMAIEFDNLKQKTTEEESLDERKIQMDALTNECHQLRATIEKQISEKQLFEMEHLKANELTQLPSNDVEILRDHNTKLQHELEKLKHNSIAETKILQHEIEDLKQSAQESADRIMELESMRDAEGQHQLTLNGITSDILLDVGSQSREFENEELVKNNADLESKLKEIMNEVQDVSNRNLFLEQQCENYLILEQSNERLKLQNAKLSRQLDETLISMQHNEGPNANTEFEYLRNIMFQYFTGTANGNNETLVKVISAVLKFSPQQTQVALEKENQRRSLINKIL